jgi:hypothetical protein
MTGPAYPAARGVAPKIQAHFANHLAEARRLGQENLDPEPDAETIEEIINAAFWASLRREEGYVPTISLAFLSPANAASPLTFERPLPLVPEALTRLGPAVERPGIHLGVWRDGDLSVWGTTRTIPAFCFVLEVLAPGLLVVKHRRSEESRKYVNVAVFEGDKAKMLNQNAARAADCPRLLTSLLGFDSPASTSESQNVLVQLAISMRAHRRGGSLLMVPRETDEWRKSILPPVRYTVSPPFSELADLMREDPQEMRQRRWLDALRRAVDAVAGLTAVDGATVITDRYELLGFGAKIGPRDGSKQVERVLLTEPIEGAVADTLHPAQLGGTRHLSAAQFAQDQPDAVAMVASQDGRFTIFAWSTCDEMVHAYRVEALLL